LWVWFGCGAIGAEECELAVAVGAELKASIKDMSFYRPANEDAAATQAIRDKGLRGRVSNLRTCAIVSPLPPH